MKSLCQSKITGYSNAQQGKNVQTLGDFTFWIIQHDHPEVRAYPVANPKSEVFFV